MKKTITLICITLFLGYAVNLSYGQFGAIRQGAGMIKNKSNEKKSDNAGSETKTQDTQAQEQNQGSENTQAKQTSAVDKEEQWQKDEAWMKKFKDDCYEVYNLAYAIKSASFPETVSAEFLEKTAKLNWNSRIVTADSIIKNWTNEELQRGWLWQNYVWVRQTFYQLYKQQRDGSLKTFIEDSYSQANDYIERSGWELSALNLVKAMKNTVDAMNILYDDTCPVARQYMPAVKEVYDRVKSEFKQKIYTSDFHDANAGKVVFSKSPILIRQENPDAMTNTFKAGDDIYMCGYLNQKLGNLSNDAYSIFMFFDGKDETDAGVEFQIRAVDQPNSFVSYALVPPLTTTDPLMMPNFVKALGNIMPGVHKVKVQIQREGISPLLAEGEFTIDCSTGTTLYRERAAQLEEKQLSLVRMSKPEMVNPSLEQTMLRVTKEWFPDMTPVRAVIAQKAWDVYRHEITGVILYRRIDAEVAVKTSDGTCRVYYLSFKQDWNGSAYGETQGNSVGGNYEIKCENVSK